MAASQNGHRDAVQLLTDGRADVASTSAEVVKTVSPAKGSVIIPRRRSQFAVAAWT